MYPGYCHVASTAQKCMGATGLSSASGTKKCGSSCIGGRKCVPQGVLGDPGWVQRLPSAWSYRSGSRSRSPCPDVSVMVLSGDSNYLAEAISSFLGSGYRQKLNDYPVSYPRLFKRCLQRAASVVSGSLDVFSMTEFIVNWLKGAETGDWMSSRPNVRKAILTNDLRAPHLVDIVANIIDVWSLAVSYLEETGRKIYSDSLVWKHSSLCCINTFSDTCVFFNDF